MNKKLAVLGTGGTIAGLTDPGGRGYTAARLPVQQLLSVLGPDAGRLPLQAEQVAQIDSKDMDHGVWQQLALRCRYWLALDETAGVVVTHGSDTLEETAFFLHSVLPAALLAARPLVLTCAMRPADAADADGPRNLRDACALASDPRARGVLVVVAGQVHGAREVQKLHPARLDAFGSAGGTALARVGTGADELSAVAWPAAQTLVDIAALPPAAQWPRVEVVLSHAGASAGLIDALAAQGVAGLVLAGTGAGTLHQALEAAAARARRGGVRVLRSSRCVLGSAPRAPDAEWPSTDLAPVKARIALMLSLLAERAAA